MRCAAFVKQPRFFDVFETTPPYAIREIHTQMKCPTEACPTTDQNERGRENRPRRACRAMSLDDWCFFEFCRELR